MSYSSLLGLCNIDHLMKGQLMAKSTFCEVTENIFQVCRRLVHILGTNHTFTLNNKETSNKI